MRLSNLFGQTLREVPSEVDSAGHQLLLRAGFVRQLAAGIFSALPLGHRALTKIEDILREEMNAIGGQEMTMPVVNPAELWKRTGRWDGVGPELTKLQDRNERELVLAMTHEEVVADLARTEIASYRQLPALVYHIQTKWRDDPRPRAGLIRVREFTMKDSYSLDIDQAGLEQQYQNHYRAYFRIFDRCGLPVIAVESDVGMMGGHGAHEYMYLTPVGEDTIMICPECGYQANRQIARIGKPDPAQEQAEPLEEVATPGASTIAELAEFLNIPRSRTAKAVFLLGSNPGDEAEERLVFAVVRGDMEVNESKLTNATRLSHFEPAPDKVLKDHGIVPGYASPAVDGDFILVVDDLIARSPNLVAGANREGFHARNLNYGRDYEADLVADIVNAGAGDPCPECGDALEARRGIEVGNIFKLGTKYSQALGATFVDESGAERPIVMGSYGIGSGRLLASIAQEHHDENGLIWPISVSPYQVHIVQLRGGEDQAEEVYQQLVHSGLEVLYDDRDESPGVKFADADLIGVPIRVTVSKRSLEAGGAEISLRGSGEQEIVPLEELAPVLLSRVSDLEGELLENADARRIEPSILKGD